MSIQENDLSDAYNEGLEAAHNGDMAATCPYAFDSPMGREWLSGFYDGGGED